MDESTASSNACAGRELSEESRISTVISKSVSRAFAVLELFHRERRPLTATAIETALRLPQASALVLTRELAALGYLAYDPRLRTYFPTERLAHLSGWLGELDLPVRRLSGLADEVARVTGETTSLCSRNDYFLQIEHSKAGIEPGSIIVPVGRAAPLPCSGAGRALLSTLTEDDAKEVIATVRRREPQFVFSADGVLKDLRSARRRRLLATFDLMIPGVGAVSFPLPRQADGGAFALVVGGPTPRIRANEERIIRLVNPLIAQHFSQTKRAGTRPRDGSRHG